MSSNRIPSSPTHKEGAYSVQQKGYPSILMRVTNNVEGLLKSREIADQLIYDVGVLNDMHYADPNRLLFPFLLSYPSESRHKMFTQGFSDAFHKASSIDQSIIIQGIKLALMKVTQEWHGLWVTLEIIDLYLLLTGNPLPTNIEKQIEKLRISDTNEGEIFLNLVQMRISTSASLQ